MSAPRDENRIPVMQGISNADGSTVLPVYGTASNNSLVINDGTTGSDLGPTYDKRDENRKVAFMAVSATDGVTPVPIYVDSITNGLLITTL